MKWRELQWRDWPLWSKSAATVAIPMLLLLSTLVFSYRQQQVISAADADVRRALAIKNEIQTLNALMAGAAMAVRGYLLTGRDEFLAPYRLAEAELPDTMRKLRESIRDPVVMAHFERISALLERKFLSLEALREQGRTWPAADLQAHLIGSKAVLDEMRDEIRTMHARETNLVAEYSAAAREAVRRNLWADLATSVFVLVGGIAAYLMLFSGVVQRVKRLAMNAERLTRDEPLETLPAARDELGILAERLQNASALLAARASEAQSASQAKTRFLSRTSHELRTPLNAILGFAQILEADLRSSPQAGHADQILAAGRHLLALIDEILDIARIESGEMRIALEPLPLAPLLGESCDLIAPMAAERGVRLHVDTATDGIVVQADRQRLRQVLLNLLSNAVKYNRPGGEVHVHAKAGDGVVELAIRDTGSGIAAEDLARLFTPFERLDAERAGVEGTGLGLAVSRQIVRGMGGDIDVSSRPGEGSVFTVRLAHAQAVAPGVQAVGATPSPLTPASAAPSRRLLVIEDNPSNLALMRAIVARRPLWQLTAARDGAVGLACAREQRPELIVLDLHLPGLSGEAVLAALKEAPMLRDIPVVIISADTLPETSARLLAAGAQHYLTKPLDVARFLAALDGAAA
jgi:signal transduction histidine kinase